MRTKPLALHLWEPTVLPLASMMSLHGFFMIRMAHIGNLRLAQSDPDHAISSSLPGRVRMRNTTSVAY